jgi:hypothetical protein
MSANRLKRNLPSEMDREQVKQSADLAENDRTPEDEQADDHSRNALNRRVVTAVRGP